MSCSSVSKRDNYFASSECTNSEFWSHIGEQTKSEFIIFTNCTSPLIKVETYNEIIDSFDIAYPEHDSVNTVSELKEYLYLDEKPLNFEPNKAPNSQDLPNVIKLNFAVNILKTETMFKKKSLVFELTPEAKALSNSFILNKGKLPWPVSQGRVILKYGRQPHPIVKTATIQSNGIRIMTSPAQKVRSIFNGSVYRIISSKNGSKTILIQHGNFFTVYKNLSNIYVKKGEKVSSRQNIGEVFTNSSTGKSSIQFSIFQNTTPINPLLWIIKM